MAARDDVAAGSRPPLTDRLTGGQWLAIDFVAAVFAVTLVMFTFGRRIHYHPPTSLTAVFAIAATAPVAVRRLWPVPVAAVVTGALCALIALGRARGAAVDVTLGMAAYTAAVRCRRPGAIAVLAGAWLALGTVFLTAAGNPRSQADAVRALLVAGAAWFVGDSVRERRRYLAGLAEQAAQRQKADAERGHLAVREERVRIARELHDVVAHSLSVVTVQAGVGRRIGAARPGEALRALRAVEVSGRSALEELRRILGLLRDDDTDRPSLAPAPGIGDLDGLADTVRAAGTPVELAVTGDAAVLPAAAALTVYRIVQEALTNVVKHARGAEASVRVHAGPAGVGITVTDNGRTGPADGTASGSVGGAASGLAGGVACGPAGRLGIVGMRERAAAFGGTLEAGPRPGGGFEVRAFLPAHGLMAGQVA